MLAGNLSYLAETIAEASVPEWLHKYIAEHGSKIRAELQLFGRYEIPMPDGGKIVLKCVPDHPRPRGWAAGGRCVARFWNWIMRFLIPLYDISIGGPPKAWLCSQALCPKICRTRRGMLQHLLKVHGLREEEFLFETNDVDIRPTI